MRILLISTLTGSGWGGSEELWANMAQMAIKNGHEVILSIFESQASSPKIKHLAKQGVKVSIRPLYHPGRVARALYRWKFSFRSLFDLNPDVICINQGSSLDPILKQNLGDLFSCLFNFPIPYILLCHCSDNEFIIDQSVRDNATLIFQGAEKILFVSQHNLNTLERQLATRLNQGMVVYNPVNLDDTNIVDWPKFSFDPIQIANVARLQVECKGQDILFEVLSRPIWKKRNWQMNLYGTGHDADYLESLTKTYDIANNVRFCGHINDVRKIWMDNHLLVLPSRREGTPLALVEAMLCGRPAVVTDVGGNAEWVEEGETGFVAEAPTVRSLNAALERAWLAQEKCPKMGAQAHEVAMNKFDPNPGMSLLKILLSATSNQS